MRGEELLRKGHGRPAGLPPQGVGARASRSLHLQTGSCSESLASGTRVAKQGRGGNTDTQGNGGRIKTATGSPRRFPPGTGGPPEPHHHRPHPQGCPPPRHPLAASRPAPPADALASRVCDKSPGGGGVGGQSTGHLCPQRLLGALRTDEQFLHTLQHAVLCLTLKVMHVDGRQLGKCRAAELCFRSNCLALSPMYTPTPPHPETPPHTMF